jgi:N-acetylneuraminic acid mutarotase
MVGDYTVHFDTVEFAPLAKDGTPGPWQTCHFHMKGGRSAPGVLQHGGRLYVLGGWGDLLIEDVFADVQYAPFKPDGQLAPWHTAPYRLKMPLYGHAVLALPGERAVVLGGNAGEGNYFANIQEAKLVPSSGTGPFQFTRSQIPDPRWGHTAAFVDGRIYVLGGAVKRGFLNTVVYATVQPGER